MNKKEKMKNLYANLNQWETDTVNWLRKTRPKICTVLRHVSNSGMFRLIDVYTIRNNEKLSLTILVEKLTHYKRDKQRQGLRVTGCGMDMGFAVVYDFSSAVFPTGFKYRKNEWHRNNDPSPVDNDGGYALNQEWI